MLYIRDKEDIIKYYSFALIVRVLAGFQRNELIIELDTLKPIKVIVHYSQQRNYLVELFKLARTRGILCSRKDKLNNPYNINFVSTTTENSICNASSTIFIEYSPFISSIAS